MESGLDILNNPNYYSQALPTPTGTSGGGAGGGGGGGGGGTWDDPRFPQTSAPTFDSKAVNPYLDQGASYEDISKNTGYNLDAIRSYADTTRPGYGVSSPEIAPTSDPYTGTTQSQYDNAQTVDLGGTGTNTPSAPAYDQNELRNFDQQQSLFERLLQSTRGTLDSGLKSIDSSYNRSRSRSDQDKANALGDLGYQRGEVESGKTKAINQTGDNSRVLRNSLMRILGQASGGGSAFDMADMATAREATKNRSGVMENYASNMQGLDRTERDTMTKFQRLLEDLDLQKKEREEQLREGVTDREQSIVAEQGQLAADRAALIGGDQFAAADPYRQQYLQLQNTLDALPGQFATDFQYNPNQIKQPTLKDYMVNRSSINGSAPGPQTQYSPYANFLKSREDEQRLA